MVFKGKFSSFQKTKKKCTSINKTAKKDYFKEATKYSVMTNKEFWKKLKPFLTKRECFSEDQISIEINDELINDEKNPRRNLQRALYQ